MIRIADNGFLLIEYDEQTETVYAFYNGVFNNIKFTEAMSSALEFSKIHPTKIWIQNALFLSGTFTKAIPYLKDQWVPTMEKQGLMYVAHALTTDVFTRFAINQLYKLGIFKHEAKICKNTKEAIEWSESKTGKKLFAPAWFWKEP